MLGLDKNPYLLFSTQPAFGGIQTKTAHVFYSLGLENKKLIYTLGKKVENNLREFGYGLKRRNINFGLLDYFDKNGSIFISEMEHTLIEDNLRHLKRDNIVFSLVDTNYMPELSLFPKLKEWGWRFVAVRESIANYFKKNADVDAEVLPHLWFKYPLTDHQRNLVNDLSLKKGAIACCRLTYKKKIDLIFDANDKLGNHENIVNVWGSGESGIYKYHVLRPERLEKYWKGKFDKSFFEVSRIQSPAKFGVNLSQFKQDGGGTENTTLEYIYHNVAVILHRDWIRNGKKYAQSEFEEGYNCFAVDNAEELADLLRKNPDTDNIVKNAKKILDNHTNAKIINKWKKYVKL